MSNYKGTTFHGSAVVRTAFDRILRFCRRVETMMEPSTGLIFVLLSQIFFVGFLIYNYIVYFQTDKIVGGAKGLVLAMLAIIVALTRALPSNALSLLTKYFYVIYTYLRRCIALTVALWLLTIGWTYQMFDDVIGRLVYVNHLQESLAHGVLDGASLPDTEALASAFSLFPDRREVPFLLSRSSRLLFQAGATNSFRSFQRSFLDHLNIDQVIQKLCMQKSKPLRHDGLIFLVTTVGEAYYFPTTGLPEAEHEKEIKSIMEKYSTFIARLGDCRKDSLEAHVQSIKFKDTINELRSSIKMPPVYDLQLELESFERTLAAANQQAVLRFWQSHAAQEYLDYQSYLLITKIIEDNGSDPETWADYPEVVKKILLNFERLLLLRQSLLRSGDVMWSSPPFKLTLFYAFMLSANIRSIVWPDQIELFASRPTIEKAMSEFTNRNNFEEFRSPRGWYAGTPLDFTLNGAAMTDKINAWLKTDW